MDRLDRLDQLFWGSQRMAKKKPQATPERPEQESALKRWLRDHHITEVECLVPDFTGNARGKIVPASKYWSEFGTRLPEGIFVTTVTGEYPDNYDDLVSASDSDMYLRGDPETRRLVPWATDPTAQVIHDCYTRDGRPHELAPRNVLKRVLTAFEGIGLQPIIAPEVEFFLVQKNTDPDFPLLPPAGRSGRPETARQSYSIDAVNEFDPILDLMYDYADSMELDVDTLIHESGAAQLEVNFAHADPMSRADQVFLFKRTMREAALRHDVYATFLAKPMEHEPGSAMHLHQSLVDRKSGRNVFAGKQYGEHSQIFMHYLAGLQNIPDTLYEAARIDGANAWQLVRHITLPLLRPVIMFVAVTQLISHFKIFGQPYIMTEGGPGRASYVVLIYLYQTAWRFYRMGYGSTIAIGLALVILFFTLVQLRVFGTRSADT